MGFLLTIIVRKSSSRTAFFQHHVINVKCIIHVIDVLGKSHHFLKPTPWNNN